MPRSRSTWPTSSFAKPGRYEVLALVRLDDRLVAAGNAGGAVTVAKAGRVPDVGEPAPR